MSVKKEVDCLAKVYNTLLNESVGDDTSPAGSGASPLMTSTEINTQQEIYPEYDESSEHMMVPQLPPISSGDDDSNKSMAKSEVFKIAKVSQNLLKTLMSGSICDIEPWMLSKLTKAADYICSVNNSLEFDEFEKMAGEFDASMSEIQNSSPVVVKVKDMLAGEPLGVNEEILKQVIFNIECLKESEKSEVCGYAESGCKCNKCPDCRDNQEKEEE